jgi:small subunit ribosomal protein S4
MKIGPQFKIARRLGERVFPKTQSSKFNITRANPGKGKKRGGTEYGTQLIEKQKARYTYNVSEKQFGNYVKRARVQKTGTPASNLFTLLETRLDNVVFRMGLVPSRRFARQIIGHGHVTVNGRRVNIPSYEVSVNDVIGVRQQSRDSGVFKSYEERAKNYKAPNWLNADADKKEAKIAALPTLGEGESNLNFGTILEFYSRV